MTMDEIFENLRQLQEILSRKFALEREIEEMPKVLLAQEEALTRVKKTFIDKNADYDALKADEAALKRALKDAETNREQAEKNMETAMNQREYEARDKEIHDAVERENSLRKDLERMDSRVNALDEQVRNYQIQITGQEKELSEMRATIKVSEAEKQGALNALVAEEKKITADMDGELLFKFERIIRNKGGKGIVAIKGGVCTGCHMILPAQFSNNVHAGEEIVFCPYCSRILYHEEIGEDEEDYLDVDTAGALSDLDDLIDDDMEGDDDDDDSGGDEGFGSAGGDFEDN